MHVCICKYVWADERVPPAEVCPSPQCSLRLTPTVLINIKARKEWKRRNREMEDDVKR